LSFIVVILQNTLVIETSNIHGLTYSYLNRTLYLIWSHKTTECRTQLHQDKQLWMWLNNVSPIFFQTACKSPSRSFWDRVGYDFFFSCWTNWSSDETDATFFSVDRFVKNNKIVMYHFFEIYLIFISVFLLPINELSIYSYFLVI
jgi:hypothetical protein